MTPAQIWTLVALGAFHGLHPGMGWLLAVSRGLQEGGRAEVLRSLPAIAAGHAASVAVAAVAITATGSVTASVLFPVAGGTLIVLMGLVMLLSRRHFHWREVRLPLWQLSAWSFLMSSAHGAGLMLMPVLAGRLAHTHSGGHGGHGAPAEGAAAAEDTARDPARAAGDGGGEGPAAEAAGSAGAEAAGGAVAEGAWSLWDATLVGLAATGVHTLAMLGAAGVAALLAHDFLGVHALRWRGVTMDRIWALTLVLGGLFVLWSIR
ncbi:cell wall anchor protein [Nocardiopsis dassonvillei]|uniref:cell wall anchor protein n=1 Tax=Nocardiopsis dassonvillei TaxID=2014 RepID=UPI0020A23A32|nr:cell wall anchor protein [Nocardiopsis dassonvillei]MCP3011742.1 cell wall anchor protein [Nocardiopsis dassonvillei]